LATGRSRALRLMLERPLPTLELAQPSVKWGSRTRAGRQPPGDTSPRATPISRWPETDSGTVGHAPRTRALGRSVSGTVGHAPRTRAPGFAGPLTETGAEPEARRRVSSFGRPLAGCGYWSARDRVRWQRVHIRVLTDWPLTCTVVCWRFGRNRRCARTLFMPDDCALKPSMETLPQTAQDRGIVPSRILARNARPRPGPSRAV
jgi:hypothetical protein